MTGIGRRSILRPVKEYGRAVEGGVDGEPVIGKAQTVERRVHRDQSRGTDGQCKEELWDTGEGV
jgi:hypothetical protein